MTGYDMACAIMKASPAALRARLREADADPWSTLATMRNHTSRLRLQAASMSARGQRLDAYPLLTEVAITEAAITKLESLMAEGVPDAVAP